MFDSAKLKIGRAEVHLRDLERVLAGFDASRACRVCCDSRYRPVWMVVLDQPLPSEIMLLAGDVVHNLRCALDHCAREIIAASQLYSPTERPQLTDRERRKAETLRRQANFPIAFDSEDTLERKLSNPTYSDRTAAFFRSIAAFPEGRGRNLVALAELNNEDKHAIIVRLLIQCQLRNIPSRVYYDRISDIKVRDYCVMLQVNERRCVSTHFGTHYGAAAFASGFEAPYVVPQIPAFELTDISFSIHIRQPAPYPENRLSPTLVQLRDEVRAVVFRAEGEQLGFRWP